MIFPIHTHDRKYYNTRDRLYDLSTDGADPYSNKDWIPLKTLEDVALTVDLSCIDFVEQSHQDEGVEDDREMLRRRSTV